MDIYQFSANDLSGQPCSLARFKGKVLLIVNTASECGFTPQLQGLQTLYQELAEQGLEILGFPCNQFGQQEPGSNQDIALFCKKNFGVTFPMFEKIDVNGDAAHPLYQYLKQQQKGVLGTEKIKWNFTKFLVNKEGLVIERFAPTTTPEKIKAAIEKLL